MVVEKVIARLAGSTETYTWLQQGFVCRADNKVNNKVNKRVNKRVK